MYLFLTVLIIIAAILLVLVVLVQNSKGGGLAANFQSSNQIMGVRRTTDFLEKSTWTLATALIGLSIVATIVISTVKDTKEGSRIIEQANEAGDPNAMPSFPVAPQDPAE